MKIMKNKYGFTLIELLAVIVILAVIALITTPVILGVIDKSKKGALQDSAYGLIDSANIYYAEKMLENNNEKLDFTFSDGIQTSVNKLNYKGKVEKGSLKLFKDSKTAVCITEGKYVAIKNINDEKVIIKTGRCEYNEETNEYETRELCQDLQDEIDKLKRDHQVELDRINKESDDKVLKLNEDHDLQIKTLDETYKTQINDLNEQLNNKKSILIASNVNFAAGVVGFTTISYTYDIKAFTSKYSSLTNNNFILEVNHIYALVMDGTGWPGGKLPFNKSYNPSTGILTVSAQVTNYGTNRWIYSPNLNIRLIQM